MPELGEIKKGNLWTACPDCGKERWVRIRKGQPRYFRCASCGSKYAYAIGKKEILRGDKSPFWKGGRREDKQGYILIKLQPDDFFYSMEMKNGYVKEHRLVMAKSLGRCLQSWEIVHHLNGIRNDNRPENLDLTTIGSHSIEHSKGYRDGFQKGLQDGRSKQIEECKQMGRREVVEWIEKGQSCNEVGGVVSCDFMPGEWQAKRKEWGI